MTGALLAIYLLAVVVEIVGIKLTVSTYLRDNTDGTISVEQAETRWQRSSGPVLIGTGTIIGALGNIVSLFAK